MADLSLGNVTPTSSTIIDRTLTASGAIAQGVWVYKDSSGQTAAAAAASDNESEVYGITLNTTTAANQPQAVATAGNVDDSGTPFAEGVSYYLSDDGHVSGDDGGMCAVADVASTEYVVSLGNAVDTNTFDIKIHKSGGQLA